MRLIFILFILSVVLVGCGQRAIPPEVTALHKTPYKIIKPFKEELIIIDAGHGGKDAGTCHQKDGYEEKKLTLETALSVADQLKKLGYKIVLTRNQDIFVPLETRSEIANSTSADLFVSIHYNYSTSQEAEGIEVYYYKENKNPPTARIVKSKNLGQEVIKQIVRETGATSRGVKQANFAVVRQTKMPAILIEAGFLSNPQEREKIKNPRYQKALAKAIAQGVDHYLKINK